MYAHSDAKALTRLKNRAGIHCRAVNYLQRPVHLLPVVPPSFHFKQAWMLFNYMYLGECGLLQSLQWCSSIGCNTQNFSRGYIYISLYAPPPTAYIYISLDSYLSLLTSIYPWVHHSLLIAIYPWMHHLSLIVPAYPWMHHHPLLNHIYIMYRIYTHIYPCVHRRSLPIFIYLIYHWMHHRSLLIYLWMHHRSLLFQLDMPLKGGSLMHYNVWYSIELEMLFTTTYTQIELIILLKIFCADTDSEISFCIWFVDCTAYDICYQYLAMRYLSNNWDCI